MANFGKLAAVGLISCFLLQGCGGGSSSPSQGASADPANFADGLGNEGHVAGTVAVGDVGIKYFGTERFSSSIDLTVMPDSTALIAWKVGVNDVVPGVVFSQLSTDGLWSKPIPVVSNVRENARLTVGGNGAGDAFLAWTGYPDRGEALDSSRIPHMTSTKAVLRWRKGLGWESTPQTFSTIVQNDEGISMIDDRSLVSAANHSAVAPSAVSGIWGVDQASSEFFRPGDEGVFHTVYSPFSTAPGSGGLTVFAAPTVGADNDTVWARLAYPADGVKFAAVPILSGRYLCQPTYGHERGFSIAAGASQSAVVTLLTASSRATCDKPTLHLFRIDTTGNFSISSAEIPLPTNVEEGSQKVAIDDTGRAIAIWCEKLKYTSGSPLRVCKWSKSLPYESQRSWSTPEDLFAISPDVGMYSAFDLPEIAMSRNGRVVAAVILDSYKGYDPRIVVSRFDFASGWAPWEKVANKSSLETVKVAINDAGTALLGYTAVDLPRIGGKAQNGYQYIPPDRGPMKRVFVLKLPN